MQKEKVLGYTYALGKESILASVKATNLDIATLTTKKQTAKYSKQDDSKAKKRLIKVVAIDCGEIE